MSVGHSIKEIGEIINRKPAMIYNYIKEDKAFFYSHRKAKDKGGYIYDDEALNRLIKRVSVENEVGQGKNENQEKESPDTNAPTIVELESKIEALNKQIETLNTQYENAQNEIARLQLENQELIKQNGVVLLMLKQEQDEKIKLLESPHKNIIQRIAEKVKRRK